MLYSITWELPGYTDVTSAAAPPQKKEHLGVISKHELAQED